MYTCGVHVHVDSGNQATWQCHTHVGAISACSVKWDRVGPSLDSTLSVGIFGNSHRLRLHIGVTCAYSASLLNLYLLQLNLDET